MILAITNEGPKNSGDPEGWCRYSLQVQDDSGFTQKICEFEHIRSLGIAALLRAAAEEFEHTAPRWPLP